MRGLFSWQRLVTLFDTYGLLALASLLLVFIPLYPKLPLFDIIPGYIVRVRIEDILMVIISIVWFVQAIRQKIDWGNKAITWLIGYSLAGALSIISAIWLIETVPAEPIHIAKTALHYFRYLEYFASILIVYSALKTKTQAKWLLACMFVALLGVVTYGYGQRYYYWPVYSTMNREFSKGVRLYLTEHARVQSTFGGHYDLSAYLVILLPMVLAFALTAPKNWQRLCLHGLHIIGLWLLVVAASRTSFFGYLVAAELVILWLATSKKTWRQKSGYFIGHSTLFAGLVGIMMFFYGDNIYERFLQVLEGYPEYHKMYHTANANRKAFTDGILVSIGLKATPAVPPPNSMSLDEAVKQGKVLASSDERPVVTKPSDVYVDVPEEVQVATVSATGEKSTITVTKDRTYSDNALKYGLSLAIRLDTLWPRAIDGFMKNPVLGSGYATLTKESVEQFTEAESTDNNFLRTLGETGLFGFITFYGLITMVMIRASRHFKSQDMFLRPLAISVAAASIGLLCNAVYIDVFAASKVAFTYWSVVGLFLAVDHLVTLETRSQATTLSAVMPLTTKQIKAKRHAKKLRTK